MWEMCAPICLGCPSLNDVATQLFQRRILVTLIELVYVLLVHLSSYHFHITVNKRQVWTSPNYRTLSNLCSGAFTRCVLRNVPEYTWQEIQEHKPQVWMFPMFPKFYEGCVLLCRDVYVCPLPDLGRPFHLTRNPLDVVCAHLLINFPTLLTRVCWYLRQDFQVFRFSAISGIHFSAGRSSQRPGRRSARIYAAQRDE